MVGYGANKVKRYWFRVLYLSHAKKYLTGYKKTMIRTKNTKLMFLCLKFIMKEFKIFWYPSAKERRKDLKFDSIKLWEFMLKDCQNIMLIPINRFKIKWWKAAKIDPSLLHKWMPVLVELIPSSQYNSVKNKQLKERKGKSYRLSIWLI